MVKLKSGFRTKRMSDFGERTREIGIRRALGATRKHIVSQFLVETGVLSSIGGLIGVALGLGLSIGLNVLVPWLPRAPMIGKYFPADATLPTLVSPWSVIVAFLVAAATGLVVDRPADMIAAAADLLAAGRTLAWFDGGSEFGPRALGHRSILADPRRPELRDYINANVKFREDFRPFAPSVLAEDAADYFELSGDSPYMLFVVSVREAWRDRIGAVVHVDGTARVQTVRREGDPRFHALLSAFKERTSVGMLLNTSLNRRGEPLVETPAEALALVRETGLHGLAIGPYLITKPGESLAG